MQLLKRLFSMKQSSVAYAALILMGTVLVSRILGLLRDRLLAGRFSPDELGVYFAAFRLPNMLFDLLVMGVLTTAFIPVFTRLLTKDGETDAFQMAAVVINYAVIILALLTIPVILFAEPVSFLLAPGFSHEQIQQMALFTRLMLIFQVFPLLIGNFLTGILQSYRIFLIPAVAPIFYNIGIIIGIILFSSSLGLLAPVVGVIIGAFFFLFIQIPSLWILKYRHSFSFQKKTEGVKEVGKMMLPRTLGLGVAQIDASVDLVLASFLGSKMVTIFNFAQHLQQLPIGLFGATIAQAALPSLSRASAREEKDTFRIQLMSAIHQILFFVLPISVFFIALRIPITRLVFGSSQFDWEATVLTGKTLSAFSLSLFAQSLIHILARAFYALYDTKTPVFISVVGIILNTVLSIVLILGFHLPVWSLGLSTSIATIIHVFLLLFFIQRRVGRFSFNDLVWLPVRMGIAAGVMGGVSYALLRLLDQLIFDTTRTLNLLMLTGFVGGVGLSIYIFLAWVLDVGQVKAFLALLKKVKRVRSVVEDIVRVQE